MGLFRWTAGGIVGGGMVLVVNGVIEKHGGLQGVINEFERNGLGATVKSWVSTGPNATNPRRRIAEALGPDLLRQAVGEVWAVSAGPDAEARQVLPQAVDTMTPDGTLPKA